MSAEKIVYIKFFAGVTGETATVLMNTIDQNLGKGMTKLVLLISTKGGNVFEGISIYNYLKGIPITVETHNFGSTDSIGNIIYVAGSKRFCVPDARFLLHPVGITFQGNSVLEQAKLEEHLRSLIVDQENIAKIIGKEVSKSTKTILKVIHDRTTLTSNEAKTFGLVHEIKSELYPKGSTIFTINKV